jgi:hypothetical protein
MRGVATIGRDGCVARTGPQVDVECRVQSQPGRSEQVWREIVLRTARAGALRTGHRRGLLRNADDASNDERKLSLAGADVERELERRRLLTRRT